MKMQDFANETYRDLCAKLGELSLQRSLISKQIKDIEAQISFLNAVVPKLAKLESDIEAKADYSGVGGC